MPDKILPKIDRPPIFRAALIAALISLPSLYAGCVPRAHAADDSRSDAEGLQRAYEARLAANEAGARRAREGRGPPPKEPRCPEGTTEWARDRNTDLCQPTCRHDEDCAPDNGRCRVLDVYDLATVPEMLFADDLDPEDVDARVNDREQPAVLVCDPLFDVPGATDAA